eukprot:CAMPEP_0185766316 /NCGR_PEP_ID=MMETSP1174-20130828/35936_1 /TAXON_ID=35687 /ORGANISM="Dictyocha speculum, Strain CCMP1381" /LENGTH=471 /DNA_ID=CAMNT_0028449909 /DNA_START=39 /DNA_END=1454 /DNA_ORIENTATION=+
MATQPLQEALDVLTARLEAVEGKLGIEGAPPTSSGAKVAATEDAKSIKAYDAYCKANLEPFLAACAAIGGDAVACGDLVKEGWDAQRAYLVMASQCKKPKPADLPALQKPFQEVMKKANDGVGRGDFENHQKTVKEGMTALSWLFIEPKPRELIESTVGGSDFWSNKIRMVFTRNTDKFDQNQHDFATHFHNLLDKLHKEYVKEYHLTGVTFNFKGGDPSAFVGAAPAAAAEKPATAKKAVAAAPAGGGGVAAIGNALSGFSTGGLKKVSKDQQTWRKEFKGDAAPAPKKSAPKPRAKAPPKVKGNHGVNYHAASQRYMVEAMSSEDKVVEVKVDDVKRSVNVYGCYDATINIIGKCKGINIDACEKTKVLFDVSISAVDMVNCKRMQIQIRGTAPVVNIDKTDGCLTYLSAESLDTTFTVAKSSEMNVSWPDPATGDYLEVPIPEQFVHKLQLGGAKPKMSAEVSELYSS